MLHDSEIIFVTICSLKRKIIAWLFNMGMLICETLGGSGSFIRAGLWGQGHMSDTGGIPVPTILFYFFYRHTLFYWVSLYRCCISQMLHFFYSITDVTHPTLDFPPPTNPCPTPGLHYTIVCVHWLCINTYIFFG